MDCEFSEFSYGYASIREAESVLAEIYRSLKAPVLPSLLQEEKLGWDAHLSFVEYALFFQFKRAQFISRRHPKSHTWVHVNKRHYRFSIDTDGHQHRALLRLQERLQTNGAGDVYYAAPIFHRQAEFDRHYAFGQVLHRSALVPPGEFGEGDGRHSYVTTEDGNSRVLSDPRPPRFRVSWDGIVGRAADRAGNAGQQQDRQRVSLGALEEAMLESAWQMGRGRERDVDAPPLRRIHRLAAQLDCGLVLFTLADER
ncbi:hypothetical protein [Micromonospora lutea]|uniref:Uncharacterized protein n=1 Tax=Micromonospora lutea TaxID=419825 RepID=A0ABQ4IYM2_9ACTN|nr:hypothetical protein [Micromonospora lutea]GIJ22881.1 hypothetical protein Vlu01_35050 [Micromonospora lutea]